jgi:hypothetical protein
LHVDAAYAGSAAVCPELRWCLDGAERADSIVVNPHKWLFTPMDCSALWTRRPEVFHETFALVPEYLAATDAAVDIKDYGPALGRRFRSLKLWFVLRWYGAEGLRALIREHVRLAQLFASWVEAGPGGGVVPMAVAEQQGVWSGEAKPELLDVRANLRNRTLEAAVDEDVSLRSGDEVIREAFASDVVEIPGDAEWRKRLGPIGAYLRAQAASGDEDRYEREAGANKVVGGRFHCPLCSRRGCYLAIHSPRPWSSSGTNN